MISHTIVVVALFHCHSFATICSTFSSNNSAIIGNSNETNTCKKVKTIIRPVSTIFQAQPIYYFMLLNSFRYVNVDNTCITLFPLPDSPETYKTYISWTYVDGSRLIETYTTKSYATGANIWSYTKRGYLNSNLGYIGCGAYVRYSCPLYGNAVKPFIIAYGPGVGPIGNGTGKLTKECVQKAQSLARENGLSLELSDIYLPPFKRPVNCVLQQVCMPKKSPLYCQQSNSCKAYDYHPMDSSSKDY